MCVRARVSLSLSLSLSLTHTLSLSAYLLRPNIPGLQYSSCSFVNVTRRGRFGDALAEVDWMVGRVWTLFEELEIANNTLFLFWSDNGPSLRWGASAGSTGLFTGTATPHTHTCRHAHTRAGTHMYTRARTPTPPRHTHIYRLPHFFLGTQGHCSGVRARVCALLFNF